MSRTLASAFLMVGDGGMSEGGEKFLLNPICTEAKLASLTVLT